MVPQQPNVAGLRDRLLGNLGDAVGIRQSVRSETFQDGFQGIRLKAGQAKVEIVVRERHYPAGLAETVAKATGAKLVELPAMVGGVPEADNYIAFIDYNIRALVKAATGG